VLVVVPGEEVPAPGPCVQDRIETVGEAGPVLERLELRFGVRASRDARIHPVGSPLLRRLLVQVAAYTSEVCNLLQSGGNRQRAPEGLSGRRVHAHLARSHLSGALCSGTRCAAP